ncbi:hypothetical protein ANACOL_02897 [Anaerotruncus colihominis DSM 17241]|uniref:Uncharacterized protein n=1 Tax=Anaerotruncus colihominis DSM 17241 TaxID=445972 RepID=B0PEA9_9FIRM|nr:hypothetical protein ANACOL_02897 [Anaerotruncus colihominis DSM 17241]
MSKPGRNIHQTRGCRRASLHLYYHMRRIMTSLALHSHGQSDKIDLL